MKLKYRITIHEFPTAKPYYTAQYKILGIWVFINKNNSGSLFKWSDSNNVRCESITEIDQRISNHKIMMKRANEWWNKNKEHYYI